MARGGGKRTYTRDANGRFASTPGGGLGAARKAARPRSGRTSTLSARTSLKKSRAKLAGKDPADQRLSTALSTRAQKGAVTRGNKGLKAAKVAARTKLATGSVKTIGKPRKSTKPNNNTAATFAPTTQNASGNKASSMRKASKKPAKKVKFQMTEADARKLGTLEADKPILGVLKTAKILRKLQKINEPKSPLRQLKRSEKLDKAFESGISAAKASKMPRPEWMPDFARNRVKEIQSVSNTPFYRHMLFKTGRTQSGPLRPGLGKKLKTMQGVSYEKLSPKTSPLSADKQTKKASSKNLLSSPFRPGEFYRGNFRPRGITGKPIRAVNPFTRGSDAAAAEKNTRIAKELTISKGIPARISSGSGRTRRMATTRMASDGKARIAYNKSEPGWADIHGTAIALRRSRFWSSSSPTHAVNHEIGHAKDKRMLERNSGDADLWTFASTSKNYQKRIEDGSKYMELARRRVSTYAYTSPSEFVAEVYAARRGGRKFDHEVMNAYKEISGRPSKSLRKQKPIRRKPKP